ncbi:MAG TPA: DNA translocase FtsK [Gemmatimonadaceae bacterium]|nr:DNA translocase FtsK [Gemmatimonadaceae bacterium]
MSREELKRELLGVVLSLLSVFLLASIAAGFADGAAARSCGESHGLFGPVGACLRAALLGAVGLPGALLVAVLPAVHALRLFGRIESRLDRSWLLFLVGMALLLPVGIARALGLERETHSLTGLWGSFLSYYLTSAFGVAGTWIILLLAVSALTVVTLAWNPLRVLLGRAAGAAPDDAVPALAAPEPARRRRKRAEERGATTLEPTPEEMPALDPSLMAAPEAAPPEEDGSERKRRRGKGSAAARAEEREEQIVAAIAADAGAQGDGDALPPTTLLTPPQPKNAEVNRRELEALGGRLMDALRTFKVHGELSGWTTGPVVTQFEVEPAPGVKVRQIANLSNDLALAMRAPSIRIVAPIPGRGAVGVEVPNPTPEMVLFRELIESREFQQARAALPIALGKDLEGKPVIADLAKMPHLLIAGATGSGKSVCVNTIITSLVYRHSRRTLRFLMVDPKMVELSVYNTLPHLRHKVITDNRDAATVLKWAVLEMQERYELLAANGCRNIQDFNRRVETGAELQLPKRPDVAFEDRTYKGGILPYIVVVIDELADLMMTVQGEVETPLAMLAQKARAIGIHLILATQRPSVNVITGLIKANFPSRIAFRVASQVDSRTIIDGAGAEMLLGNGDMLFIPPGKSEPSRMQGAFISSEDTEHLMRWYEERKEARHAAFAAQGLIAEEPHEEGDILEAVRQREKLEQSGEPAEEGEGAGERDKLFREAAEVVIQHQQGSTSLLQRRLKVGYGRAARIIDQLHDAGILGPPDGSKPRDVLVGLDQLDTICGPRS